MENICFYEQWSYSDKFVMSLAFAGTFLFKPLDDLFVEGEGCETADSKAKIGVRTYNIKEINRRKVSIKLNNI